MKDLNEIFDNINNANDKYSVCKIGDTHTQSEILRTLSTSLHDLSTHRVDFHEAWLSVYFNSKATSVSAKEKEADFKVPMLYKIRHFTQSASKVLDSLRTSISANKNG
jgi:hypothetical protein